jgi:hypothetical protein
MIRRHCDAVEVDHVAQAVADDAGVGNEISPSQIRCDSI